MIPVAAKAAAPSRERTNQSTGALRGEQSYRFRILLRGRWRMQSLHSALFAGTVSFQGAPSAGFVMTTPEGGKHSRNHGQSSELGAQPDPWAIDRKISVFQATMRQCSFNNRAMLQNNLLLNGDNAFTPQKCWAEVQLTPSDRLRHHQSG